MMTLLPYSNRLLRLSLLWSLLVGIPTSLETSTANDDRPNVIVILTDDQGWGDLSLHGNQSIDTPHIDDLARSGAQFDRFYVSPVCSPTRAEFLTGRHHVRCGVYETSAGGERVNPDEVMIGEVFRRAGYRTAAFGKWHSGTQYPYHPNARGFEEFYGFCSGHWGDYFSPLLEHNGELVQGKGFIVDDCTERAMAFVEQHQDEPFFVYLPYNTPHSPMQVPDRWWNKFKNREITQRHPKQKPDQLDHTRAALAMCENIDWNVGRLLDKLDQLKLADRTLVLFFCDNGPNGNRYNGGMRGRKGSTDEGGVRSPLLVRWPGRIKAGTRIPQICSAMDLLPTLAELSRIEVTGTKPLDGISLAPLLLGGKVEWQPRTLVHHWNGKVSVRSQRFRLDHRGQLYDIPQDPGQTQAVNQQHPEVVKQLGQVAEQFRQQMLKNYGRKYDRRPFVIGHPDAETTLLPARDGVAEGKIKRSNRWPNDSFFQDWTRLEDAICWNGEVGAAGDYLVEMLYACPAEDIGASIELSFAGQKLRGKISEAHGPPLRGMEHDRFPRMESYVKSFKRMKLGTLRLEQGPGTLKLQALEIPGGQVMELRMLILTRLPEK